MVIVMVKLYGNSKVLIIGPYSESAGVEKGFWETLFGIFLGKNNDSLFVYNIRGPYILYYSF